MTRMILDTDLSMGEPGSEIDDGFALALALAQQGTNLELVTTVNGNTDVETATVLSIDLLQRLGRSDIPVVKGAAAPLLDPCRPRPMPETVRAAYGHHQPAPGIAAEAIVAAVRANPGELTLVPIGPLTNVALALGLDPTIAHQLKDIVIMGGVFLGSTNRADMPGEFNVWVDPEAAQAVIASGAKPAFVGLDVTLKVQLTREHAHRMVEESGTFGRFAGEQTLAWLERLAVENPGEADAGASCAMHDPLAVAVVERPDLVTWRDAHLRVDTGQGPGRGSIVADLLTGREAPEANARIAVDVDAPAFLEYFLGKLSAL